MSHSHSKRPGMEAAHRTTGLLYTLHSDKDREQDHRLIKFSLTGAELSLNSVNSIEFFTNYTKISVFTAWKQKNPVIKCYPQWE